MKYQFIHKVVINIRNPTIFVLYSHTKPHSEGQQYTPEAFDYS